MKKQKIIKIDIPKEIWEAHMSICNWNRDIIGAWMRSTRDIIEQIQNNNKTNKK